MPYEGYATLTVEVDGGVAHVTFDHSPINLLDGAMAVDLHRLSLELADDDALRVTVFRSANPDFFIAHADVNLIPAMARDAPPPSRDLSFFHGVVERFRTLSCVTIAMIEGRARGGGSEFALSLDLRFAAIGRARLSQPEVALGIIPGGGGTQRLPRLMGRARALEAILGCEDFDAELAEHYGWVNRALPPEELEPFVSRLARRIASFPPEAIALAKQAVDASEGTTRDGLLEENRLFLYSASTDAALARMQAFLENGGQTREAELELARILTAGA
jgi:enoyl-CoA hydratase/carnithine racemase